MATTGVAITSILLPLTMLTMATNFRPSATEAVDQGKILKFSCVRDVRCYNVNVKNVKYVERSC